MKIVDSIGKELQACVMFDYKGYMISASTVFRPHSVFVCDARTKEFVSPEQDTIEDAIQWIEDNPFT